MTEMEAFRNMSAFATYLSHGIDYAKKLYPSCVSFIEAHKGKAMSDIVGLMRDELKKGASCETPERSG